jgi:flagellar biogenesis protein FliO
MVPIALLEAASTAPARVGPDLTRYVLVCATLLLALGGLAWLLRRTVVTAVRAQAGRRSLQVIDVLPLGGKQRLCVVRCYDRTFALGVGEKEIGLIAEIDAAVSTAQIQAPAPGAAFGDVLARITGRKRPAEVEVLS